MERVIISDLLPFAVPRGDVNKRVLKGKVGRLLSDLCRHRVTLSMSVINTPVLAVGAAAANCLQDVPGVHFMAHWQVRPQLPTTPSNTVNARRVLTGTVT